MLCYTQGKLGWQVAMCSWDRAVWLASFGSEEQLKGEVAVPKDFIKHRKEVALIFSDQVPVWTNEREAHRKVFAVHENINSAKACKKRSRRQHAETPARRIGPATLDDAPPPGQRT